MSPYCAWRGYYPTPECRKPYKLQSLPMEPFIMKTGRRNALDSLVWGQLWGQLTYLNLQ
jgi:hypothetical protein